MTVFRIAKKKHISKLNGMGSYLHGGRWTSIGTHAIYTAEHRSLAYLEYIVHQISLPDWPVDLAIAAMDVNERDVFTLPIADLPERWKDIRVSDSTKKVGDQFFSKGYLALRIPSVIVPDEYNLIVNPLHSDFGKKVKITKTEELKLDERFRLN
ncbi:MAG: RES family NAD+ phosphorylase [Bacteroidota bacterium]